jgi:gas vesicle protein
MSDGNSNHNIGGILAAFAVGAVVGAGVALLYAPRSGRETRELLGQKTRDLRDKATDALDDVKDTFRQKKSELVAAVEAGKQAVREERAKQSVA